VSGLKSLGVRCAPCPILPLRCPHAASAAPLLPPCCAVRLHALSLAPRRDLTYRLHFLAVSVRSQHSSVGGVNAREDGGEADIQTDFTVEERQRWPLLPFPHYSTDKHCGEADTQTDFRKGGEAVAFCCYSSPFLPSCRILEMKNMSRLYSRMIKSIAPTIFGRRAAQQPPLPHNSVASYPRLARHRSPPACRPTVASCPLAPTTESQLRAAPHSHHARTLQSARRRILPHTDDTS
jgi:hypothetical protein